MSDINPQTILQESKTYADSLKSEIVDALNRLESMATGRQTWVSFAAKPVFDPSKTSPVNTGSLPSLEKAVLSDGFTDPTTEIEKYKTHVFVAPMLDDMQSTLMGWVDSGGVGISDSVQNALWNNQRERDLQNLSDALDAVRSIDAKRGFKYATHRRKTSEVIVNYQQARENRNHEITALIADLAQKNVQQAMAHNISIEQLHANFSLGLSQIFLNLKNHLLDRFRVEQEARVAEFEAKMKAILAGYNLGEVNAKLDMSYQELLMKQWEVEIASSTERTRTLIQQAEQETRVKLEAATGLVNGLAAQISSALLQTNGIAVTTSKS